MNWDLFGLLDQGQRDEQKRILAEELARTRAERRTRLNIDTKEATPKEETKKENPGITDVAKTVITTGSEADMAPREVKGDWWSNEEGGFDLVKNIAQGWYFDVPENVANTVSPMLDKISPKRDYLMLNLPFLKNYDPARDYVFTMPADEFNALKEKDKVSYMPNMIDERTEVGDFARNMTKVFRGLSIGKNVTDKALKSPVFNSVGSKTKQVLEYTTPGAVASQIAFQPHEERISNMIAETVQDTPVEFVGPFFEWLQADPENSEAEERFKMLLESYVVDAAFSPIFRLMKGRKEIIKAELDGKSADEIITIEQQAEARLLAKKIAESDQPLSRLKKTKSASQKVLNAKLEDPTIFSAPATVKRMVEQLARGDFKGIHPDNFSGYRVFNTKYIENGDAAEALNMMEVLLRKEMLTQRAGLQVPKGPKTLAEIEKAGLQLSDTIQGNRIINVVEDTASGMGVDKDTLMTLMMKDLDDLAGLEARVLAYRGVISQMGSELQLVRRQLAGNPGNEILEARFINLLAQTEDAIRVFGEVRRIPARTVTAQRIKIPDLDANNVPKNSADHVQLLNDLKKAGIDSKKLSILGEALGLGKNPLHTVHIAQTGIETILQRGTRGLLEFYRGMLLASLKTHVTNSLSGVIETFVPQLSRLAGGLLTGDRHVVRSVGAHMVGLTHGLRPAIGKMIESVVQERNILDPLGTKVDGLISPYGHAIAMDPLKKGSSAWHPYNWVSAFVNGVGKVSRGSLRLLGGEDEFFKQWNYRAAAYSKIVMDMPEGLSKEARKLRINQQLGEYFDDMGQATNKDLLQYARRATFTEEVLPNTMASGIQALAKRQPALQFFIPFIRTPTNIMVRFGERTPIWGLFQKTTRQMLDSGDPNLRAQVIGNQAIGMAMYGTFLGYIMEGSVTGPGPLDPDQNRLWRNAGNQPYSIRTPYGWVSYNRLDPLFMPLVFMTSAYETASVFNESDDVADQAMMGVVGLARAATDRTYLQGMKQVFQMLHSLTTGDMDRLGLSGVQMGANVIPSIINQQYEIGQHFGFYEGAEGFREALQWQEKFLRRAPQLTGYNAVKHNWLTGEPIVSPVGYNSGFPVAKGESNKYINEIVNMGRSIDPPDTKIGNVELTGPQYAELNRLIGTLKGANGKTLMKSLEDLMETDEYNLDPNRKYNENYDDWRVTTVKGILRNYKDAGRKVLLQSNPELLQEFIEDKVNKASVMSGGTQLFDLNERP